MEVQERDIEGCAQGPENPQLDVILGELTWGTQP